jgi:hypothetical protein
MAKDLDDKTENEDAPVPDYKKLDEALAQDKKRLQLFNEEQKKGFVPVSTPTVYAFIWPALEAVNQGLNAVKVGDTHHADYAVRLNQWSRKYGEIEEVGHIDAFFDHEKEGYVERVYFRDYAVHKILEYSFGQARLEQGSCVMPPGFTGSLSKETFIPLSGKPFVTQSMLEEIWAMVKEDHASGENKYKTYSHPAIKGKIPQAPSYIDLPPDLFDPYRYQKGKTLEGVGKFLSELIPGTARKIILDAPTRSGKSYMLAWMLKGIIQKQNDEMSDGSEIFTSKGCQPDHESTLTVITTGFPDVFDEFRRTIEKHAHFRDFFHWITKEQLLANPNLIEEKHAEGKRHVVIALSLQDLAGRGSNKGLKKIHERITGKVSFVLGDECHFAMFSEAEVYKAALAEASGVDKFDKQEDDELNRVFADGKKAQFLLSPKYGYIFSSATTYSVLDKNVFDREKDIVFISPYAIQAEMEQIEKRYADPLESPFFGRPRKHYLGVELGCSPSAIFTANDNGDFVHAKAARAVVAALFGIEQYEGLPPLFASEVLKEAGAGNHMLFQMPSKNSCDALEKLFRNLGISDDYHLLNISSKKSNQWQNRSAYAIKEELHRRRFGKTITITVARFVTGVSVPQWDTVILANAGQSLTRRIQTYGRVETPWVEVLDTGGEEQIKYCQKPNCFVIDLHPEQLYAFCNQVELHSSHLADEQAQELPAAEALPGASVFSYNGLSMKTMTIDDIHQQLDEYIAKREISELAAKTDPMEELVIDDTLRELIQISGSGKNAKASLNKLDEEKARRDYEDDDDTRDSNSDDDDPSNGQNEDQKDETGASANKAQGQREDDLKKLKEADRKRRTFIYKRLMLAALLVGSITNPKDLIHLLETDPQYKKLADNIGLGKSMRKALLAACGNFLVADNLERAIKSLLQRGKTADDFLAAIVKLDTLSDNEVFTPVATAELMVDALGLDFQKIEEILTNNNADFVDPGSKSGILLLTVYRRATYLINKELEQGRIDESDAKWLKEAMGKQLVAVPTSPITYEIIRKLYLLMGWEQGNIVWTDDTPAGIQENWAYFVATNTGFFVQNALLPDRQRAREMREKLLEEAVFSTIKKEQQNRFVAYLLELAKLMSDRFDYSIGNPPYQDGGIGNKNNSKPIYPDFFSAAQLISNEVVMIHPSRAFSDAGERSAKKWAAELMADSSFLILEDYKNAKDIFPTADIKGGVAITSYSRSRKDGGYHNGYIANDVLRRIANKVCTRDDFEALSDHVYGSYKYSDLVKTKGSDKRLETNWLKTYGSLFVENRLKKTDILVYGRVDNQRVERYIDHVLIREDKRIKSYKVLVPKSNGSGAIGEVLSTPLIGTPLIGTPLSISTRTYITIGILPNEKEARAVLSFVKTKFARAMLGTLKVTQDNHKHAWKNVPWQDFTAKSDIDWSKSIKEIDQQLYKKYGLSKEEIKFIEDNVQEMK